MVVGNDIIFPYLMSPYNDSSEVEVRKSERERAKLFRDNLMVEGGERLKKYKEAKKEAAKKTAERERVARNGKTKKQKTEVAAKRAASCERTRKCRENKRAKQFPPVAFNEMVAIPPPTKETEGLVFLRAMDEYLRSNRVVVKREFELYAHIPDSAIAMAGIRLINGGRYEVFVNDMKGKIRTGMFDWIVGEAEKKRNQTTTDVPRARIELIRKSIIVLANTRALKDSRVGIDTVFQNHALIVSLDPSRQQDAHIDLDKRGHFQFGLICTDQVFGTIEYIPQDPMMKARCNLVDVWHDVPKPLASFLARHQDAKLLLKGFGRLLSINSESGKENPPLPLGTLLSLPGEVVHAGPRTQSLRAILFFTGTPHGEIPYSSEVQHTRTTLLGEIIMLTWMELQEEPDYAKHRTYLLMKWNEIGLANDSFALNNMHHRHLIEFAKAIVTTKNLAKKKFLIEELAKDEWDENDWGDPDYKYVLPKPGRRKQAELPTRNTASRPIKK